MKTYPSEKSSPRPVRRYLPWIIAAVAFLIQLPLFYHIAQNRIDKFNSDREKTSQISGETEPIIFHDDQHVYLNTGRMMRRSGYTYLVQRHRTPGYPFLLSLFYSENDAYPLTEGDPRRVSEEYFARGKQFNVILTMACLVAIFLFLACGKSTSIWTALMFTWAVGWFTFIFRAPYTQPEVIFTTLSFIGFVLLARQIQAPTWKRGIASGVILAAAFMVKAAILPLLALFVACFAIKFLLKLVLDLRNKSHAWKPWLLDVARGSIIPILFVTLLSPYLLNTWKKHGSPFWSVHSQHYMWLESREDKHKWRGLLGIIEKEGRAPADAPSREQYFENHTLSDFIVRGKLGVEKSIQRVERDYRDADRFLRERLSYVVFLIIGIGLAAAFVPAFRRKFSAPDSPNLLETARHNWIIALYFAGFTLGYLFLYGCYQTIGAGPRLVLSMFPTVLFGLWVIIEKLAPVLKSPKTGRDFPTRPVFQIILALSLIIGIIHTISREVYRIEGGN